MVIPFSNTKLRVPKGFQSLLVGLSTEVLRSQPKNIHAFAADYFEKLLQRREKEHGSVTDSQTAHEDRYYNNQSFQESYPVNRADVNSAATKIQAQFRGHKTRRDLGNNKDENKDTADEDEEEFAQGHDTATTSARGEHVGAHHQEKRASPTASPRSPRHEQQHHQIHHDDKNQYEPHPSDRMKNDQERAATTIQAQFRGYQTRRTMRESNGSPHHQPLHLSDEHHQGLEHDHHGPPALQSVRSNQPLDSDRHESHLNFASDDHQHVGEHGHTDRSDLPRASGRLSDGSEGQQRSIGNFQLDQDQGSTGSRNNNDDDDDDMNDPNLEKAATRIQASYRGYKTRKELGSPGGHSQSGHEQHHADHQPPSISPQMVGEFDSARSKKILSPSVEGNRGPVGEEDDNAAAVKIQAAYRGYRVRKDLEK